MVAPFGASSKQGGSCMGSPDVCKTPAPPAPSPVPVPYPNSGQCAQALNFSTKVKLVQMNALTQKSEIPMSQGDEAGVAGGVTSGQNMGPISYKNSSTKVKFEGIGAVCQTSMTAHNGKSANMPAGQQVAPSQQKVKIAV